MMRDLAILWNALLSHGYLLISVVGFPVIAAVLLGRWISRHRAWIRLVAGCALIPVVGFFALVALENVLAVANPVEEDMALTAENLGPLAAPLFILPVLAQAGEALKNFGATLLGSAVTTVLATGAFGATLWRRWGVA
ncbi:hypothetical protein [Jannaschia pohangensis]|uniref:Uncharacterized protein n=1 Tax=Jannaschia pohangensis TaxID=390807 RepID=A0A1I3MLG2_9RHOB|nr:hypothetical protein [Jannaschia pohangensis]SFI97809.1 hypothetical protein SAMN04488095_1888 [Jannaschia pohangensis]